QMTYPAPWIRDLVARQLSDNFTALVHAQFHVDAWFQNLPLHEIFETGRDTSLPLYPLHYWTHRDGRQIADFIGRVENFEADFTRLCQTFGIVNAASGDANVSVDTGMPDANGYRYADRMSAATRARIEQIFA